MNLIIDKSNRLANEWCWEWHYIMSIFREIEKCDKQQYQYILTDNLNQLPVQPNKNIIVIIVSDEQYTIPKYTNEVKAIFKNYVYPAQESLNIYPIPQGYNKDLVFYPYKQISERKYDVGFQGNFHTSRPLIINNILNEIQKRNLHLNLFIQETQKPFEYSKNLLDTKISLCLDGQITPENFRFFESSILGCGILASDALPKNWIYDQTHYIKVNWKDPVMVVNNIEDLLNNNSFLEKMSNKSYEAWENLYSPTKIANYILTKLNNI
jgi:hypothetical protein